jgi:hypothetical protein
MTQQKKRGLFHPGHVATVRRPQQVSNEQINKLLVMLSIAGEITSDFNEHTNQWEYDVDGAVRWVELQMGYMIDSLGELTNGQIGACFEELDG